MRSEKQLLLDQVKQQLEEAPAFVLTSYYGVNPNLADEFRSKLYETGGFLYVIKKRVFLKAAEEAGIKIATDELKGHLALVYTGDDTVATTKAVFNFRNENKDLFEVLGGRFEGKMCSPAEVEQISKLPSKERMRSEFLGLLEAPMSGTLAAIEAILSSIVYCIDNKVQNEGEAS